MEQLYRKVDRGGGFHIFEPVEDKRDNPCFRKMPPSYPFDEAAALTCVSNHIIKACLLADPDRGGKFVKGEDNYSFYFYTACDIWGWVRPNRVSYGAAVVSTKEAADHVVEYLNATVKLVGCE